MPERLPEVVSAEEQARRFAASAEAGHAIFQASHLGVSIEYDISPEGHTVAYVGTGDEDGTSEVEPIYRLQGVWRRQGGLKRKLLPEVTPADILRGDRLWLVASGVQDEKSPKITGTIYVPLDDETRAKYLAKGKADFQRSKTAFFLAPTEFAAGSLLEMAAVAPPGVAITAGVLGCIATAAYIPYRNPKIIESYKRAKVKAGAKQMAAATRAWWEFSAEQ